MMSACEIIANHLENRGLLPIENVDAICAFSGKKITEGVPLGKLLSANFTDMAYLRYPSQYAAVAVAQCMQPISEDGRASLRNYSFLATPKELRLLSRAELLGAILQEKQTPFVLCITYNGKKHISYKAKPQCSNEMFTVYTDAVEVVVRRQDLIELMPILSAWYSIIPGKEATSTQPTYFTKDEILHGSAPAHKILAYGEAKYFEENNVLEKYRRNPVLGLIVFTLQKQQK